jgi:hypothetical protein
MHITPSLHHEAWTEYSGQNHTISRGKEVATQKHIDSIICQMSSVKTKLKYELSSHQLRKMYTVIC